MHEYLYNYKYYMHTVKRGATLPPKGCSTCPEDIVPIRVLGDFPWGERKTPLGNVNYTPKEYTVHQIWVPLMDILYTHYALAYLV